jgi:poly(3-hydroxybutyrate) depolymerase
MSSSNLSLYGSVDRLKRSMLLLGAVTAIAAAPQFASAACSYKVDNEWQNGFTASITITNDTGATVNGWSVNWAYSSNRMTNGWNANFSGSNPYTATSMSWNGNIAAGQSISFGVQGTKSNGSAERPQISGSLCSQAPASSSRPSSSAPTTSAPVSSPPSSSASSVVVSSVRSSSSAAPMSSSSVAANACPSQIQNAYQMLPARIPATIQAEDFDPAGYSDSTTANEGGAYRTDTGVDIKSVTGGNAVGWMTAGEWLEYTVYVETEGDYDLTIRSGAAGTGRTLRISQCDTTLVQAFQVPSVSDWGQFTTASAGKIRLKAGYQKIRVTVGATDYVDLDWIHIGPYTGGGGDVDPPPPTDATRSDGCGKTRTLQNGRINITSNNTNRSYILRVPDNYNNQNAYRLIVGYHWLSGNATQVANGGNGGSTDTPFYGLWNLAQNSTIFIAPEGLDAGWANSNGRDVAFTDAFLNQVQSNLCIDKSRIFATGFSYGAGMSYAIACARANVFRGVALYAGALISGCDGGNSPIPFFAAHGIDDNVLTIAQGRSVRDRFVSNNRCNAQNPLEPNRGSGTHICTSYQGCTSGYPVRWCAFDGGHYPTQKDNGQSESWIPREAWQFISQF